VCHADLLALAIENKRDCCSYWLNKWQRQIIGKIFKIILSVPFVQQLKCPTLDSLNAIFHKKKEAIEEEAIGYCTYA
jgi:hypothetical protein